MTGELEGGEWSAARPGRTLPPGKTRTHCTGGWVGPRAGLDGRKYLIPHRDSIPDCPARSQSLYRLSYLAQHNLSYRQNSVRLFLACGTVHCKLTVHYES